MSIVWHSAKAGQPLGTGNQLMRISNENPFTDLAGKWLGVAGLIALAGCAVQTNPVSQISRLTQANLDKKAMFADQDPITKPITL